jgi:autoinducer 2-degrading protein
MVRVIASYRAQAGRGGDVAGALARHAGATRREHGCRRFTVLRSREEPDECVLDEEYEDEAAFQAHRETPHFRDIIESQVVPILAERRWGRYDEVEAAG